MHQQEEGSRHRLEEAVFLEVEDVHLEEDSGMGCSGLVQESDEGTFGRK